MKILVTGGAGFIGSEYVRAVLSGGLPGADGAHVTVLDSLSYCGNRQNLAPVAGHRASRFVRGDICDPALVNETVPGHDVIVHFAAESHVDRSIRQCGPMRHLERPRDTDPAGRGPAAPGRPLRARVH